jgi:surface polysaccharide O-acyltransferase-like enzyme
MQPVLSTTKERNFALDLLRIIACLLVIWQHASEFFYIGPGLQLIPGDGPYHLAWLNSLSRCCIGLFVMISGYFLLPMRGTTGKFYKKHLSRILIPFVVWCVAYAVYYVFYRGDSLSTCLTNIAHIPLNFGTEVGHLWFIYMLFALYLIVPIISPWLEKCSKHELQAFLGVWLITTLFPYIHLIYPAILGECSWNDTPSLYYFTGFIGYFVLGHYVRRYGTPSAAILSAILIIGYVISALTYRYALGVTTDCVKIEIGWGFCTINVAMMTFGVFGLVSNIKIKSRNAATKLVTNISLNSYAMYLLHIMILNFMHDVTFKGIDNVWIAVPSLAVSTFICTYILTWLLSHLPKANKWLGTK